jgi:hypothetical protein
LKTYIIPHTLILLEAALHFFLAIQRASQKNSNKRVMRFWVAWTDFHQRGMGGGLLEKVNSGCQAEMKGKPEESDVSEMSYPAFVSKENLTWHVNGHCRPVC